MNILIPTDFSIFSQYAIDLACQISRHSDSQIILFHCIDPENASNIFHDERSAPDDISIELNRLIAPRLQQECEVLVAAGFMAKSVMAKGNFVEETSKLVSSASIDLIIMGSQGHSGLEKLLIGSNTFNVLRNIQVNTIVVKSKIKGFKFSQVVFASSLELRDRESFNKLIDFLSPFNVDQLHVLTIDISGAFSQPSYAMKAALNDFQKITSSPPIQTHFEHDVGIIKGIKHFCNQHSIDLIVMPNHEKSAFTRIFKGSPLEKLIYKSSIPILSLTQ